MTPTPTRAQELGDRVYRMNADLFPDATDKEIEDIVYNWLSNNGWDSGSADIMTPFVKDYVRTNDDYLYEQYAKPYVEQEAKELAMVEGGEAGALATPEMAIENLSKDDMIKALDEEINRMIMELEELKRRRDALASH